MRHLKVAGVICAVLLAPAPVALAAASPTSTNPYLLEQGNANPLQDQGSNPDFRSIITSVTPHVPGLQLQVLQFSDRLSLVNATHQLITIYGYSGEPYARVLPNGAVQLNERSPALYLNTNFYANVTVPASAQPGDPPQWAAVYRTGTFEWHDHRIHWMSPILPQKVQAHRSTRQLIFDWTVPISVGGRRGAISGELFWTPETSKGGPGAIIALIVVAVAGLVLALWIRRRRGGHGPLLGGPADPNEPSVAAAGGPRAPEREAW